MLVSNGHEQPGHTQRRWLEMIEAKRRDNVAKKNNNLRTEAILAHAKENIKNTLNSRDCFCGRCVLCENRTRTTTSDRHGEDPGGGKHGHDDEETIRMEEFFAALHLPLSRPDSRSLRRRRRTSISELQEPSTKRCRRSSWNASSMPNRSVI